jgi:citrate synthase
MAVTTGAGLEGVIATASSICFIDGEEGVLSYHGYDIRTLGEHASFEEVIFLLWHGRLPQQAELDELKAGLVKHRPLPAPVEAFLKGLPKGFVPMAALRTAVSMLALYDPQAQDMSPEANEAKALKLMAQTATIVTSMHRLRSGNAVIAGRSRMT